MNKFKEIYILIAGMLWGTQGLFMKNLSALDVPDSVIGFIRTFFAFITLLVFVVVTGRIKELKVSKKTLFICIFLGLTSQAIYNVSYSISVNLSGMSTAVILLYTAPIFTCIGSIICFNEKLTNRKIIVLIMNIIGSVLTVTGGVFHNINIVWVGIFAGLISGLCYGLTPIIGKFIPENDAPIAVVVYNFLFASIYLFIFSHPFTYNINILTKEFLINSILLGFVATAIPYVTYFYGLKIIDKPSKVPIIASIEVIIACVLGMIFFGENLNLINVLGIILVLLSIVVMNASINHKLFS